MLWYSLYRPLLFKFLGIQKPLNIASFSNFFQFLIWIVLAIILGTATHIIWDGLTHLDFRTFAFKEFLAQPVSMFDRIYPMHKVLQIGCSVVALPFLMWMGLHYFFKYKVNQIRNPKIQIFCIALFTTSFFSGCIYYVYIAKITGLAPQDTDLYVLIGFFMKNLYSSFCSLFYFWLSTISLFKL